MMASVPLARCAPTGSASAARVSRALRSVTSVSDASPRCATLDALELRVYMSVRRTVSPHKTAKQESAAKLACALRVIAFEALIRNVIGQVRRGSTHVKLNVVELISVTPALVRVVSVHLTKSVS